MSNILKVSVPTGGLENTTRTNPITTNDVNIQNVVDPSKVVKPDGQRSNPEKNLGANYESNFQNFIQELRNKPELVESFSQMFFQMGSLVESGIGEDFAAEIAQFLDMITMNSDEAAEFLISQSQQNNKFSPEVFQMLKNVMDNTKSVELKTAVLNFMKSYNDASSSSNTLDNIVSILKSMSRYMPQSYRQGLMEAAGNLKNSGDPNATEENIAILKKEIIPFLSTYTLRTHDMGRVRDFITLLTLNTARYENGTMEKFFLDFQKMASFQDFKKEFGNDPKDAFDKFLKELTSVKGNSFSDKLVQNISRALNGEGGYEVKTAFQNIMSSFLINESVYMPLQHFIFPAQMFGNMIFSEIWVDPDSKRDGGSTDNDDEKARKMLIKFDIKDVGFFDMIILSQGNKLDLQLRYPEKFQPMEKEIRKDLMGLVEKNGMVCQKLFTAKANAPVSISEVFPQIYERKNAVNVKI